ncbi:DUF2625 domain-containing protein [Crossiella sp. SN42]|uniref:DUF2625 family protein n=1 Tax=Crossiella sp. SN42 TaxID=2944808 RepID=UPI00207C2D2B|nr:DUF2625 family protein [Crossiella sp. SN42]MCO1575664.1 DUF2625 domain-containing protein [Crossiella sp. SN42]
MDIPADFADLLARGRHPLGAPVELHLGADSGPFAELAELLSHTNGFTIANGGVQVFRAGTEGLGPELAEWNEPSLWKDTYGELAADLFCFGQDLFGVQFAVSGDRVVSFDPETAERTNLGGSLADWMSWLAADLELNAAKGFATDWQDRHGPLGYRERLLPVRPFVLGGKFDEANLVARDAVYCMRVRGPIAQKVHGLPDGAEVRLHTD